MKLTGQRDRKSLGPVLLLAGLLFWSGAGASSLESPATGQQAATGLDAFDFAFRFASAIKSDRKDQGRAQEAVLLDLGRAGELDAAIERADRVTGWRRGSVYADLASMLAEVGRFDEAERMLVKARSLGEQIEGWQERRVQVHIAAAMARLGDIGGSEALADEVATGDPRQYAGRAAATVAGAHAVSGDFDTAMARLDAIVGADLDVVWWRTAGYLQLADAPGATAEQRNRALDRAIRSAGDLDGWKQAEALIAIANETVADDVERTRKAMARADEIISALPESMPVRVALMSELAVIADQVGRADRARELLATAERQVPTTMTIDRPGLYAQVASAYRKIGDTAGADRVYDAAFTAAESLVNARPRALAVVEICRSMGRDRTAVDPEIRGRLDRLFYGLGDPW